MRSCRFAGAPPRQDYTCRSPAGRARNNAHPCLPNSYNFRKRHPDIKHQGGEPQLSTQFERGPRGGATNPQIEIDCNIGRRCTLIATTSRSRPKARQYLHKNLAKAHRSKDALTCRRVVSFDPERAGHRVASGATPPHLHRSQASPHSKGAYQLPRRQTPRRHQRFLSRKRPRLVKLTTTAFRKSSNKKGDLSSPSVERTWRQLRKTLRKRTTTSCALHGKTTGRRIFCCDWHDRAAQAVCRMCAS